MKSLVRIHRGLQACSLGWILLGLHRIRCRLQTRFPSRVSCLPMSFSAKKDTQIKRLKAQQVPNLEGYTVEAFGAQSWGCEGLGFMRLGVYSALALKLWG